jgi:adenosine kinase
MSKHPPIVVTGSIAIDRIMQFNGRFQDYIQPDKLDVLSVSVFLDKMTTANGGVGANIAYSLALLGETPYLLGAVGTDAALYMEQLAHSGVNITHVFESNLPTASFSAITDRDQNQISGFYPGAMFDSDSLSLAPWKDQSPIILISAHDPKATQRQVAECVQWDLPYCYDIGQQVSNTPADNLAAGVHATAILMLNEYELEVLAKKIAMSAAAIKQHVPIVVTTLGKKGSVIEGKAVPHPITVGVVPPTQVVDPTGAGDAFRAGFFYGFARGWHLQACGQLGAVCATYAIEMLGTQGHHFTLDDAAKRYETTFHETIPSK